MVKRVVILGAGYGGVRCALTLEHESEEDEIDIFLVDKHNYHRFMIQAPGSAVGIAGNKERRVLLAEVFARTRVKLIRDVVLRILPRDNRVVLEKGTLDYDYLVVGLGSEPEHFSTPGLVRNSLTLGSLNSAKSVKNHIEKNFAAFQANPLGGRELLTVVVGGAGFTGIELADKLADLMPSLAAEYNVPLRLISLICIEAASSILKEYDRQLIENAYRMLEEKGVRVITGTSVENVTKEEIKLSNGQVIKTGTFIWAGGIRANRVVTEAGFTASVRGRASVNKYLQAVNFSNVYLIGDNAFITNPATGDIMGPTARTAVQTGHLAALNILAEIRGADLKVFDTRESVRALGNNRKYLYSIGGFRIVAKKLLE